MRSGAAVLALSVALVPPADGGDTGPTIHLAGGWSRSRPPALGSGRASVGDIFTDGGAAGIGVAFPLGARFEAVADLAYDRLAFDPDNPVRHSSPLSRVFLSADRGASVTSLTLAARARHRFGRTPAMSVYAVAGGGPARAAYDVVAHSTPVGSPPTATPIAFRDTGASLLAGAGADAALGRHGALGAEVLYRRTFLDRQRILGLDVEGARHWTLRLIGTIRL